MKFITLAIDGKSKSKLLFGPEVSPARQRRAVQGFRTNGLPDGIERVEVWERKVVKVAVRQPELPTDAPDAKAPATPQSQVQQPEQ